MKNGNGVRLVQVEIEGLTPLLESKAPDEIGEDSTRPVETAKVDRREVAERAVYRTKKGECAMPSTYFAGVIKTAGESHKQKGSRKSLRYVVPAAVRMLEDLIVLHEPQNGKHPLTQYEIDSRTAVNQKTKGRITTHRPRFDTWGATFNLEIEEDVLREETVHQLLEEGGRRHGVGAFRPSKGGPFGRFRVIRWEILS